MKVLVLLSGGMDSTTLLYKMHQENEVVSTLGFDYGAKHNHRELPLARYHSEQLGIPHQRVPLDVIAESFSSDLLQSGGEIPEGYYADRNMVSTVVPFRNAIMLSIATGLSISHGAEAVAIASHAGDHTIYPDCTPEFTDAFAQAMLSGTYEKVRLLRPFEHYSKADIAHCGDLLQVDYSKTWSCYKGESRHCGRCGTCVERREAFQLARVPDPTQYAEG